MSATSELANSGVVTFLNNRAMRLAWSAATRSSIAAAGKPGSEAEARERSRRSGLVIKGVSVGATEPLGMALGPSSI